MNAQLDLAITNDPHAADIRSTVLSESISDHDAVMFEKSLQVIKKPPVKISFRNYKNVDLELLGMLTIQSFESEWDATLSLDEITSSFIHKLVAIYDKLAPIRSKTIRPSTIPKTVSVKTKGLISFRNSLQSSYRKNPNPTTAAQIKAMHRTIRRNVNYDTRHFLEHEIDQFGVWAVKKKLFTPASSTVHFDKEQLNLFYSSVSNEPIPICVPKKPPLLLISSNFSFSNISKVELIALYKDMKNKQKRFPDVTGLAPSM
jgi:hypothetical protein